MATQTKTPAEAVEQMIAETLPVWQTRERAARGCADAIARNIADDVLAGVEPGAGRLDRYRYACDAERDAAAVARTLAGQE